MQFVYPGFLLALLAVSVPILIHLFNFRRFKKSYFTNIKFLHEVKEETNSKSRIKHLLILIARILFITFLVLAFAQPFIPLSQKSNHQNSKLISLYLDNSFSMNNVGEMGQLFNTGRQYAYSIIKEQPAGVKIQIVSNELNSKSRRLYSKEQALERISEIEIGSRSQTLDRIFKWQNDLFEMNKTHGKLFIISDFQKTTSQLDFLKDSSNTVHLVPLRGNKRNNVSIDSCWFETPVRKTQLPEILQVKITNHSEESLSDIPLKLTVNGELKSTVQMDILAESSKVFELHYTLKKPGWVNATISLEDNPILFDDTLYISYYIPLNNNVLSIITKSSKKSVSRVFERDSIFQFSEILESEITLQSIQNQDLIVLNETENISSGLRSEIKSWVMQGGRLFVIPPPESKLKKLNEFLEVLGVGKLGSLDTHNTKIADIDMEHPLFSDVFESGDKPTALPSIHKFYPILNQGNTSTSLLSLSNGLPYLLEVNLGKGKLYLLSSPLQEEYSSFDKHSLFVVSLLQMALYNTQQQDLYATLGKDNFVRINPLPTKQETFMVKGNNTEFIPEIRRRSAYDEVWYYDQIKKAGHYQVFSNEMPLASFSINYPHSESTIMYYSNEELDKLAKQYPHVFVHYEQFNKIGKAIAEVELGKQLWQFMLLLALLMMLFEILLIKFWKE